MSSTAERKLAAIMFNDIAGYTAQMSKDEAEVLRASMKMCFELLFLSLFRFVCQTTMAKTDDVCVCLLVRVVQARSTKFGRLRSK